MREIMTRERAQELGVTRALSGDLVSLVNRSVSTTPDTPDLRLTQQELGLLGFLAQGYDVTEISEKNGLNRAHNSIGIRSLLQLLGAKSPVQAVIKAVNAGVLDLAPLMPEGFDPHVFEDLPPGPRKALSTFFANQDAVIDSEAAYSAGMKNATFAENMKIGVDNIGARNRTQAMAFFLEARRRKRAIAETKEIPPGRVDVFRSLEQSDGILSPREIEILTLVGRGYTNSEIGEEMSISVQTVKNHVSAILLSLGVSDRTLAVRTAVEFGEIELSSLLPSEVDLRALGKLSEREQEVVLGIVEGMTHKEIGYRMKISEQTVKNHVAHILKKTRARDKTQVAVLYLESKSRKEKELIAADKDPALAKPFYFPDDDSIGGIEQEEKILTNRQLEVLIHIGKGHANSEIARNMVISEHTVKNSVSQILERLNAADRTNAFLVAMDMGIVTLSDVVPDNFDPTVFDKLSPMETEILKQNINDPSHGSNLELATVLGISEQTVKNLISSIYAKTKIRGRTAIVVSYLETMRRKETGKLLSDRDTETLYMAMTVLKNRELTQIDKDPPSANPALDRIKRMLLVKTLTGAVVQAIKKGELKTSILIDQNKDISIFSDLGPLERKILRAITDNPDLSADDLARELQTTENTIVVSLSVMRNKLGVGNKAQAIAMFLEAQEKAEEEGIADVFTAGERIAPFQPTKRQIEILQLTADGLKPMEIAGSKKMKLQEVMHQLDMLRWIYNASTNAGLAIRAANKGIVTINLGIDKKVGVERASSIDEDEVLKSFACGLTTSQIAENMRIAPADVQAVLSSRRRFYKAKDNVGMVIKALDSGDLDISRLVPRSFELSRVNITGTESNYMEAVIKTGTSDDSVLAEVLGISPSTFKTFMNNIIAKIRARNRTQAIAYYMEAKRREGRRESVSEISAAKPSSVTVYLSE